MISIKCTNGYMCTYVIRFSRNVSNFFSRQMDCRPTFKYQTKSYAGNMYERNAQMHVRTFFCCCFCWENQNIQVH